MRLEAYVHLLFPLGEGQGDCMFLLKYLWTVCTVQVDCFELLAVYQDVEAAFIFVLPPIGTEHMHFLRRVYLGGEREPAVEGIAVFVSTHITCS